MHKKQITVFADKISNEIWWAKLKDLFSQKGAFFLLSYVHEICSIA